MHIRPWRREDLPHISQLLNELCSVIGHPYHNDTALLKSQFEEMRRQPDVYRSYVCEIDQKTAGFISLVCYASVLHQKGTALINELVVGNAFRGKGVGRALMEHALALAEKEGWDELEVGVEKENTKALQFYKACGVDQEHVLLGKEFD